MGPGGRTWLIASLMLFAVQYVRGTVDSEELVGGAELEEVPGIQKYGAKFDYYVFSQQWPGTFCRKSGTCCKNIAKPVKFTVHGLWPENEDGSWPSCCSGPGFDEEKVGDLYPYLLQFWPTLSCHSPRQCKGRKTGRFGFWQHEWEKHGTCSYPIIPDEGTYFSVGLNLHQRYDLSKILSEAGFLPSFKRYATSALKDAVADAVGAKPAISCNGLLINEIWICLTKDLKVRNCNMPAYSCGTYIEIPPFGVRSELPVPEYDDVL